MREGGGGGRGKGGEREGKGRGKGGEREGGTVINCRGCKQSIFPMPERLSSCMYNQMHRAPFSDIERSSKE